MTAATAELVNQTQSPIQVIGEVAGRVVGLWLGLDNYVLLLKEGGWAELTTGLSIPDLEKELSRFAGRSVLGVQSQSEDVKFVPTSAYNHSAFMSSPPNEDPIKPVKLLFRRCSTNRKLGVRSTA